LDRYASLFGHILTQLDSRLRRMWQFRARCIFGRPIGATRLLCIALVVVSACSRDPVIVRTELLSFEPQAHLKVGPVSLANTRARPSVDLRDGEIETGRAFYCDLEITQMTQSGVDYNYVEVSAIPPDGSNQPHSLDHDLVSRKNILPYSMSNVVQPLQIAGQWRGIVTVQEGPDGIRLGPARQVAEFTFEVVESKSDSASK